MKTCNAPFSVACRRHVWVVSLRWRNSMHVGKLCRRMVSHHGRGVMARAHAYAKRARGKLQRPAQGKRAGHGDVHRTRLRATMAWCAAKFVRKEAVSTRAWGVGNRMEGVAWCEGWAPPAGQAAPRQS